ncbi:MAG: phosphoribosylformylglycinamidine cyclo-ligase [Treponema sp.]|jgi:phosphoribosylformylglycinamidine cyclo-ligase|nr:phosphoribosylformylglycinamidine cyclo-ligase [Treponema sp.]
MDYKEAGVDIAEGYRAVERYRELSARTANEAVLNGIGGFAGLYALGAAASGMEAPVLVSGADGVGTKLDIAFKMRKYDTVGIDCVAMCVNDVLCHGARPLFFLDYLACGKLDADVAAEIVRGVARGCRETGTALLGGETAEMPGFYEGGKYDIAGFCVGIVDRKNIVDGSAVREGDALVGLASSGPHSNGFSLIRASVPDLWEDFGGMPLGMALLEPTRLYVRPVLGLMEHIAIHGMAHITGGGFYENIPRLFAPSALARGGALDAVVRRGAWAIPPIFARIAAALSAAAGGGNAEARGAELLKSDAETQKRMFNTFNMGIGFVLAVAPGDVRRALEYLDAAGFPAWEIGLIERGRAQTAPLAAAGPKGTLRFV